MRCPFVSSDQKERECESFKNPGFGCGDDLIVIDAVVQSPNERRVHPVERDSAGEPGFFKQIPIRRIDQLDALATELFGDFAGLFTVPVLGETPVHDRLIDAADDDA